MFDGKLDENHENYMKTILFQIDAMETILHDSDTEISTSTLSATVFQSPAKPRTRREPSKQRRNMADVQHAIEQIGERRYMQVYAQCYCQLNRLSSVRKRGSCYAAYKVGKPFLAKMNDNCRAVFHSLISLAKNCMSFTRPSVFVSWTGWPRRCGHAFLVSWEKNRQRNLKKK